MEILSYIFWVLLAIMILVFVHEMGHFLLAKLFKMRVDRFSIGFPPKILSKQIGETEYVLGATPLGGYVKIAGMVDESMDTEYMESEPQPWEFRAKPVWQRIIVITAGVIFNVILAALIFTGLKLAYGEAYIPPEKSGGVYVEDGSIAYKMGLRTGDRVLAMSGKQLERYDDLEGLEALLADPLTVTVARGADTLTLSGPDDIMTQLNRRGGTLGLSFNPSVVGSVMEDSPAAEAGLQAGDRIIAIDGKPVMFWRQMTDEIQASDGREILLRWERPDSVGQAASASAAAPPAARVAQAAPGRTLEARLKPEQADEGDRYFVGIYPAVSYREYGLGASLAAGVKETWLNTKAIVTSLSRVVSGRESFRENVGGPIMIAKVTKQAAEAGPPVFWNIVAMLSITLAIMNILPIPALDGGHLVFLIYEGVTRREPSLKVRMVMQQVGMILLLAFMTFLIFNDILRL